jgi:hypothetical protein
MSTEEQVITKPEFLRDVTFTDARGMRYAEIAMVTPEAITIYNSSGLSEAPVDQWDALNVDEIKERFHLRSVIKNGPHWWLADTATFQFGQEHTFGGMGFRWAATLPTNLADAGGGQDYKIFVANKRGSLEYSKGKPIYELVSPEADTFVMQSSNIDVDDDFAKLGKRLSLPDAWQFRARTLDGDLTVELDGKVKTVMDDLRNVYNFVSNGSPGRGQQ